MGTTSILFSRAQFPSHFPRRLRIRFAILDGGLSDDFARQNMQRKSIFVLSPMSSLKVTLRVVAVCAIVVVCLEGSLGSCPGPLEGVGSLTMVQYV